jgi:hypothetical protein
MNESQIAAYVSSMIFIARPFTSCPSNFLMAFFMSLSVSKQADLQK